MTCCSPTAAAAVGHLLGPAAAQPARPADAAREPEAPWPAGARRGRALDARCGRLPERATADRRCHRRRDPRHRRRELHQRPCRRRHQRQRQAPPGGLPVPAGSRGMGATGSISTARWDEPEHEHHREEPASAQAPPRARRPLRRGGGDDVRRDPLRVVRRAVAAGGRGRGAAVRRCPLTPCGPRHGRHDPQASGRAPRRSRTTRAR